MVNIFRLAVVSRLGNSLQFSFSSTFFYPNIKGERSVLVQLRLALKKRFLSLMILTQVGILLPSGTALAGGRLTLIPELGFFSLTGTDTSSNARAVVSTIHDYGLNVVWNQPLGSRTEGILKFKAKSMALASPGGAAVLQTNQVHTNFAIGASYAMGPSFIGTFLLDYSQYLLMQSANASTIVLNPGRWPGLNVNFELLVFRISKLQLQLGAGGTVALPIDMPGYSLGLSGETQMKFGIQGSRFTLMIGPFFRYQTTGTSVMAQYLAELGLSANLHFTFGKGRARSLFLFSPRR